MENESTSILGKNKPLFEIYICVCIYKYHSTGFRVNTEKYRNLSLGLYQRCLPYLLARRIGQNGVTRPVPLISVTSN